MTIDDLLAELGACDAPGDTEITVEVFTDYVQLYAGSELLGGIDART